MLEAAALFFAFASGAIQVTLAPDQPVPFVYTDDPLIVEFKSEADTPVTGHLEFTGDDGEVTRVEVPAADLRANGTFWFPVQGAPIEKGRYQTRVILDAGGVPEESEHVFCRIDRPERSFRVPLCVQVDAPTPESLLAFPGIPVRNLQFETISPDAADVANRAAKAGFTISLYSDFEATTESDLEAVAETVGDRVVEWVLDPDSDLAAFESAVAGIHRGGCRAPIVVAADTDDEFRAYLESGSAPQISAVATPYRAGQMDALASLRRTAEEVGLEGFPIHATRIDEGVASDENAGPSTVTMVVEAIEAGATHCELNSTLLYGGGTFGSSFVETSALVRHLDGASYVGRMPLSGSARAAVFRKGNEWRVVAWNRDEAAEIPVPVGETEAVFHYDDCNNPMPEPAVQEGVVRLTLTREPHYLEGHSGDVIALAARNTAQSEARAFVADDAFGEALPEEAINLVKAVADSATGRTDRLTFFGLLRLFPFLEQQWHDGALPRETAVPAIASLARLVRSLCTLEQEAGEPFIELLQETLARSGEYQSQYLTGAGGAGDGRGRADWLSSEISRLMAEAKSLAEEGREIEAVGVASLAEWRARSLEFAARAEPEAEAAEQ